MKKRIYLLPLGIILMAFLVVPLIVMVIGSFKLDGTGEFTLNNFREFFTKKYYYESFFNSVAIGLVSSILGMIGSFILCTCLMGLSKKSQEKITFISNLAGNFAGIPLAFAFIILLGNAGVLKMIIPFLKNFNLYSWLGLSLTFTYFQIPLGVLFLFPSMREIKKEWKETSSILGSSTFYYWKKVVIPFLKPSIISTFVILFANGMGTYETAYALTSSSINLFSIRISALVAGDVFAKPNMGSALATIFGVFMIVIMVISQRKRRKEE